MATETRSSEYLILREGDAADGWIVVKGGVMAQSREQALKDYLGALPEGTDASGTYVVVLASNWIPKSVKPRTGFEIG